MSSAPTTRLGLERFLDTETERFRGRRLALLAHPPSVDSELTHAIDRVVGHPDLDVVGLFGPQHGILGEKQDNMIESASGVHEGTGLPLHSLYGEVRQPTPEMLAGLDTLLVDMQDVGVRIYTFAQTLSLVMEACGRAGVSVCVLDRPNPVGSAVEGPCLEEGFESFVGLHPNPLRHGMTMGEIAHWYRDGRGIDCELEVVTMEGWDAASHWDETGLPWVLPSPNLPTLDSCVVYPGMVLLEGTELSEGRGTTRPFELVGAPGVDPQALAAALTDAELPGTFFRPCHFEPTFQKHAGALCGGVQVHVTDRRAFLPVATTVALLAALRRLAPEALRWRDPPFEYEEVQLPIDILWGSSKLREAIDAGAGHREILADDAAEAAEFTASVAEHLLYPRS
ncbi:MAG: DUF1343 domain-containing protein [Acidobacteriota bacterium]